jgi:hypothetical protein
MDKALSDIETNIHLIEKLMKIQIIFSIWKQNLPNFFNSQLKHHLPPVLKIIP